MLCVGQDVTYPILADADRSIAVQLGMLSREHMDAAGLPLTVRSVHIIGPDKKVKLIIAYPASTGRNFTEILRCLDSLQLTATRMVPALKLLIAPFIDSYIVLNYSSIYLYFVCDFLARHAG
jgi:alkyl hydroperoxide reductase subunit AhpC